MTLESLRDIIIVVFGIIWTLGFVLILVMMIALYRRLSALQASITGLISRVERAVAESKEAIKPIMQIAAMIDAVRGGVELFSKISEMKKGGTENEQRTVG